MIARGVPAGTVCLRCQLRFLRQIRPFPVRYVATNAAATSAADAGTTTDTNANRTDDGVGGQDISRDVPEDAGPHHGSTSQNEPLHTGTRFKHIKTHKRRQSGNRILNQVARSLRREMLGKPAYAIVMEDRGTFKKRSAELEQYEIETAPESTSFEALLDSQREPATTDETRSNIHSLRPSTDKVLSRKEFEKLQGRLTSGFLNPQLDDYVAWYKSDAARAVLTDPAPSSQKNFPRMKERSAWVPLQSETSVFEGSGDTFQGYVSEKTTPKQRRAIRLMRDCWDLSIAELQTQLGETWVKLDNHDFITLMRGTQRFMNTLVKIWLDPGERVEAFRNQKMLRVVTTKHKADAVLNDLNETLKCITTKTFPINLLGSGVPDDTILEQVGKITNSHVRLSHTSRRLHVTWIDVKSRAARGIVALEDISHIAFRLLLTASGAKQVTSSLLSPTLSKGHRGRLIIDATSKEKLGWKDRLTQWARYTHPLLPGKGVADAALPIKDFKLPFQPLARWDSQLGDLESFPKSQFPAHPVKWSNIHQTSTTAHFGHVLHAYQPSNPTPLLPDLLASTERRVFAPSTPHPIHLARLESSLSGTTSPLVPTKSTILLRFWPSPSSNPLTAPASSSEPKSRTKPVSKHAGDAPPAPILELRLATSDHEVLGVESLRAITRTHHTDIMLPSSPIDVRFTQTQYETLQARDPETLAAWQPLRDFLGPARLDLANGKLEMPPRQKFPIPQRLITTSSTTSTSSYEAFLSEGSNSDSDPENLTSVTYEFVGLELHRSAILSFEGHQLTYTSIEAGQGGGRQAEVTLNPVELNPATSPVGGLTANEKHLLQADFLACCSRLVTDRSIWSSPSGGST